MMPTGIAAGAGEALVCKRGLHLRRRSARNQCASCQRADHRRHDPHRAKGRGAQRWRAAGFRLVSLMLLIDAQPAVTQERVVFRGQVEVWQRLVAAHINRAENDSPAGQRFNRPAGRWRTALLPSGGCIAGREEHLGAEQPHAFRADGPVPPPPPHRWRCSPRLQGARPSRVHADGAATAAASTPGAAHRAPFRARRSAEPRSDGAMINSPRLASTPPPALAASAAASSDAGDHRDAERAGEDHGVRTLRRHRSAAGPASWVRSSASSWRGARLAAHDDGRGAKRELLAGPHVAPLICSSSCAPMSCRSTTRSRR